MFVTAIIAAAGRGTRLGGHVPKQMLDVGGRTLLERSVRPFEQSNAIDEIVVALPSGLIEQASAMLARLGTPTRFVPGGARRQDSVAAGLAAAAPKADVIAVHDAARPFCSESLVERVVRAAAETGAAIAALPAHDTVKEVRAGGDGTFVTATLPREQIFLAQTPQAFSRRVLLDAIAVGRSGIAATDEAGLAERAGHEVRVVPGEATNMKITTEDDLRLARAVTTGDRPPSPLLRVGVGYDLHRIVEGRRLVLGGVDIPGDRGLFGHSDADVLCHAVTDAVLGGAGAGDIGQLFPDDDPDWKGAVSLELLRRATAIVHARGYRVQNVDAVVITDWPKIRDHAAGMRENLADALSVDPDRVTVKGKTSEGVGPIGRGEAIAVHAVAMVSGEAASPA